MGFFKKIKEQNILELQKKLNSLQEKYKNQINCYHKIGSYIFILKGFDIINNEIYVLFKDKSSVEGYNKMLELGWWKMKYDTSDFIQTRINFLSFKEDLKKLGLELKLID